MLSKQLAAALAALVATAGYERTDLYAADATPAFVVRTIDVINGAQGPDASGGGGGASGGPAAASSPAVQLSVQFPSSPTTAARDLATVAKGLAGSPAPQAQAPAQMVVTGNLTWTGTSVQFAPMTDAVTPDLVAAIKVSALTADQYALPTNAFSLTNSGSGSVILTITGAATVQTKGSATLRYRFAAKPWSIAKYTLVPGNSAGAGANSPLNEYELSPSIAFLLPKSKGPSPQAAPATSAKGTDATAAAISMPRQPSPAPPPPTPTPDPRANPSTPPTAADAPTAPAPAGGVSPTPQQPPAPPLAVNVLQDVTVTFVDKGTTYTTSVSLQEGQTLLVNATDRKNVVYAREFQVVPLPGAKEWPGNFAINSDQQATDTWYLLNATLQAIPQGTVEIHAPGSPPAQVVFSGSLSSSLPAATSGLDKTLPQFVAALNSSGKLPAGMATLTATTAKVSIAIQPPQAVGLVLGKSATLTLTGPQAVSGATPALRHLASWSASGRGILSVIGSGTPQVFHPGDAPNVVPQNFCLSSTAAGTLDLSTRTGCKQSVAGTTGGAATCVVTSNQNLLLGSGTLQFGDFAPHLTDLVAADPTKALSLDSLRLSFSTSGDAYPPTLVARSSGTLARSSAPIATSDFNLLIAVADLCNNGVYRFSLSGSGSGSFPAQSPVPWEVCLQGAASVPCSSGQSGSYAVTVQGIAGSATGGSVSLKGVQACIPTQWSGTGSLTLGDTACGSNMLLSGPATAAICLAETKSWTITIKGTLPAGATRLLQFPEAGHRLSLDGTKLVLTPSGSESQVTFGETTYVTVVDAGSAAQLVSLWKRMRKAAAAVTDGESQLQGLQGRLTDLQAGRESDEDGSAIVVVNGKVEQAQERVNRARGDYRRASFNYHRVLADAEEMARRHTTSADLAP